MSDTTSLPVLEKPVTSLDGSITVIVRKLKAGQYDLAQSLYTEWLKELQTAITKQMSNVDLTQYKNADGTPDVAKIESVLKESGDRGIDVFAMMDGIKKANEIRLKLVATGIGKTVEEIQNDFYPEDIATLANVVIELNCFVKNLKNAVAPIVEGA